MEPWKTNLQPSKLSRSCTGWLWVVQVVTGDSQEEVLIFRDKQTLHHNIYIIILTIIIIIVSVAFIIVLQSSSLMGGSVWGRDAPVAWFRGKWISVGERKIEKRGRKGLELLKNMSSSPSSSSAFISAQSPLCWNRALGDWPSRLRLFLRSVSKVAGCSLDLCITMRMTMVSLFDILAIIVVVGLLQDD